MKYHDGKKNIFKVFKAVRYPVEGWCVFMGNVSASGAWLPYEKLLHINFLELKAILLAIKSFVKTSHKHIQITSGNTTAINSISKMGTSHSMKCHHQVLKIWEWAIIHKNHLTSQGNQTQLLIKSC